MQLAVPSLSSDDVMLRPPAERDIDAIFDACQDPEIPRWTRVPSPYARDDAVGFVHRSAGHWGDGSEATFVMATPGDELLGAISLMHLADGEVHIAEIGYWVAAPARRRGVATTGVRLVSVWGLCELGLERIELMTELDNTASQGVAARNGFTREGVMRSYRDLGGEGRHLDLVMFSLVRSDLD